MYVCVIVEIGESKTFIETWKIREKNKRDN